MGMRRWLVALLAGVLALTTPAGAPAAELDDLTSTTDEAARADAQVLVDSWQTCRAELLKRGEAGDPAVEQKGDLWVVREPVLIERDLTARERDLVAMRAGTLGGGKVISYGKKCYTLLLPGSAMRRFEASGTVHFMNYLDFTVERGERRAHVLVSGSMTGQGASLTRQSATLTSFPFVFRNRDGVTSFKNEVTLDPATGQVVSVKPLDSDEKIPEDVIHAKGMLPRKTIAVGIEQIREGPMEKRLQAMMGLDPARLVEEWRRMEGEGVEDDAVASGVRRGGMPR